jgi:uncharacterized protein YicC (UPF0701 family)
MATLALAVAACGESDQEKFRDAYEPVDEKLSDLGEKVQDALQAAENKSDEELARQFDGFADDMGEIKGGVVDLDPPSDVEEEVEDLEAAVEDVESSLRDIATAGERSDPRAARTATIELIQQGERLDQAQQKLVSGLDE